ncbi:MAG: imelysin family protein [Pseudomonadota bacterium]
MGRRRRVLKGLAAAGLAPVWRPATLLAGEPIAQTRFADVNSNLVTDYASPRFNTFAEAAHKQAEILVAYDQGDATLEDAKSAFHDAIGAWMKVQHLRFGAAEEQMRDFRIQFWPDKRNRVGKQLGEAMREERQDLLDPEVLADASVALQGFPALERLVFVEEVAPGSYGGALAVAVGNNLASMTDAIAGAWAPAGATGAALLSPGSGARYSDPAAVTAAFVGAMAVQLEFIAQRKLSTPLGESLEKARPRTSETWRSGGSLTHIATNLTSLSDMYGGGDRIGALVVEAGFEQVSENLQVAMAEALANTQALGADLPPLVEEEAGREQLEQIVAKVETAHGLVAGDIAGALDLVLGFNSLDGD